MATFDFDKYIQARQQQAMNPSEPLDNVLDRKLKVLQQQHQQKQQQLQLKEKQRQEAEAAAKVERDKFLDTWQYKANTLLDRPSSTTHPDWIDETVNTAAIAASTASELAGTLASAPLTVMSKLREGSVDSEDLEAFNRVNSGS